MGIYQVKLIGSAHLMITNTVGESDTKELLLTPNNPENGFLVLTCDAGGRKDVNTDCT